MNVINRIRELNQYTQIIYNVMNDAEYPPEILVRLVYHPKYYKALEGIMSDEKEELLDLQNKMYDRIVPWITSKLPDDLVLEYATNQYYPYLFVTDAKTGEHIGQLNLGDMTFDIFSADGARDAEKRIDEINKMISDKEKEITKAYLGGDYSVQENVGKAAVMYIGRKHFAKKAMQKAGGLQGELDVLRERKEYLENERANQRYHAEQQRRRAIDISNVLEECGFRAHFVDTERKESEIETEED